MTDPLDIARRMGAASRRVMDETVLEALRDAQRRGETLQAPEEPSPYRYGSAELDAFFAELERKEEAWMQTEEYREMAAEVEGILGFV